MQLQERCQYTALSSLTENGKKVFDNKDFGGAVLTDLSKGIYTINHNILPILVSLLRFATLLKVYKDNSSFLKDLFKKDNSFNVHDINFQSLTIELFQIKENLSNTLMNDILQTRTLTYNSLSQRDFAKRFVNTAPFGLN